MKFLRNKRRLAGLTALGVFAAVMLFVVLPAMASDSGDYVNPPSGANVLPYDVAIGGTGDCANLFTGPNHSLGSVREYDNVNPKTKVGLASGNNDGVSFDLSVSGSNSAQRLAVLGHGPVAILGIGIKGGTHTTAYDYKNSALIPKGYVTSDTNLHAPLQTFTVSNGTETGTQWYSISQLTVCYTILSYIQGHVYQDSNQDGVNNDGSPRVGWTVNLYNGGTLVDHQTTDGNGFYHFDVLGSATRTVCEAPTGDAPPTGQAWVQTQPAPSTTTNCSGTDGSGTNELAKGYTVTSSDLPKTADFGNVLGYPCNSAPVGVTSYTVGTCKAGQLYVFNSGTRPDGTPFVDYWVGDPNQSNVPVVERINFDDPFTGGQPSYTKLLYADGGGYPPTFNNLVQMPYCNFDPRTNYGNDDFGLKGPYDTLAGSGAVFPNAQTTSCVISIKIVAPANGGPGKLQAFVYALGDSVRLPT
jgi:hypothetical protein